MGSISKNITEQEDMEEAEERWPEAVDQLKKAETLKKQVEMAKKKQIIDTSTDLRSQESEKRIELSENGDVRKEDFDTAEDCYRNIYMLEGKLSGCRLQAKITPQDDWPVEVRSLATDRLIAETYGNKPKAVQIKEAVSIEVPDVVSIQLVPYGIDVDRITSELHKKKKELSLILEKYSAPDYNSLKSKMSTAVKLHQELSILRLEIRSCEQGYDLNQLIREIADYPKELPALDELEDEVKLLCGSDTLEMFIGSTKKILESYRDRYVSEKVLAKKMKEIQEDQDRLLKLLRSIDEIPEEFTLIENPDGYADQLKESIEKLKKNSETALTTWSSAYRALGDTSAEEYSEAVRQREQEFEDQKSMCSHWMHIKDVFSRLKSEMKGKPTAGIEESFQKYLAAISKNSISLEEMRDNLSTKLVSGRHPLSVEILSDGTKDTISLAFRLAVLEYLYPDGGAVVVFDDPFTDMDPERVEESCKLVQKFAENNQVIFVTCDNKYRKLLNGKNIDIARK